MGEFDDLVSPGRVQFQLDRAPVSLQAPAALRREIQLEIRQAISGMRFFLVGEVKVSVEWLVPEQVRYETDQAADLDNILKPMLDALTGPEGILVDDCQVQQLFCNWIDVVGDDRVSIAIEYLTVDKITCDALEFVQFPEGVCIPLPSDWPIDLKRAMARQVGKGLEMRHELMEHGVPYFRASGVLPIVRRFHRSRVRGFAVVQASEILEE